MPYIVKKIFLEYRDLEEEDAKEIEASKYDLSYSCFRWKYWLYG